MRNYEERYITDDWICQRELHRVDDIAAYFGVTAGTIRLWIKRGFLKAEKIAGVIRIPKREVLSVQKNRVMDI